MRVKYKWLEDTAASSIKEDNSSFRKKALKLVQSYFTPQKITLLKIVIKKPSQFTETPLAEVSGIVEWSHTAVLK